MEQGGGDIAIQAAREARKRRLHLSITLLENDIRVLPFAYQAIRNYPEIRIVEGNALEVKQLGNFDFIFSNHMLHHLSWADIRTVLDSILVQTRIAFVLNDLKRSNWSYLGYTFFSRLFTPGSYHFHDGRMSIRRGFLPEELQDFIMHYFPGKLIRIIATYPSRVVLVHTTSSYIDEEQHPADKGN